MCPYHATFFQNHWTRNGSTVEYSHISFYNRIFQLFTQSSKASNGDAMPDSNFFFHDHAIANNYPHQMGQLATFGYNRFGRDITTAVNSHKLANRNRYCLASPKNSRIKKIPNSIEYSNVKPHIENVSFNLPPHFNGVGLVSIEKFAPKLVSLANKSP